MNAIITINICDETHFNKVKNPIDSIKHAANRWKADYIEIGSVKYPEYNPNILRDSGSWNGFTGTKMWQLIWIMENYTQYKKILILDTDIIINSKAPNLFSLMANEDIAAVLDGNPNRLDNVFYNNSVNILSDINNCIEHFKHLYNFDEKKYKKNYINTGVLLINMETMCYKIKDLKEQILSKKEIFSYIEKHDSPIDQNLFSAWVSCSNLNLRILSNEWNWIAPDSYQEYDEYLGPMSKMIYHFTGTNLAKERSESYDRWK
jgi:lipopolysaccharide biosynthesis glycosyltransferase